MAPGAVEVAFGSTSRPVKKRKVGSTDEDNSSSSAVPPHPLGIKPTGNAYTASVDIRRSSGFFSRLPEELLLHMLESFDAKSLVLLGHTCKALYAFTRSEDLWKQLFVRKPPTKFRWHGLWRSSYLSIPASEEASVSCQNLFSDVLYRPFFCANASLQTYVVDIPHRNQIPRFADLSADEYSSSWTDKPFILTEPVKQWPAYKQWSMEILRDRYGDVCFRAEAVDWPLHTYIEYMHNNADESPLYLFDCRFAEKMDIGVGNDAEQPMYWPPECIGEDLFALLGPRRPDSRWLIVGPERSGSTFHKDPNATSAWNAVLTGRKYWLMFPPDSRGASPPGVFVSPDGAEVTSPLSIAEYMLSFHAEARRTPGCVEAVCQPGELLHVPSGWFHLVLNLEPGIALTQNFVPRARVVDVLAFLRDRPEQVSGFDDDVTDPYGLFLGKLREEHPDIFQEACKALEARGKKGAKACRWESIVAGHDGEDRDGSKGFSFGFAEEDDT